MRYALAASILLAISVVGTAWAQLSGSQNVLPAPLPSPQLSPRTTTLTSCMINCDTAAMNCQNSCVPLSPVATPNPVGSSPCNLGCTTQQLVCKQGCQRAGSP